MTEFNEPPLFDYENPKPAPTDLSVVGHGVIELVDPDDAVASGRTAVERVRQRPEKYFDFRLNVENAIALVRASDSDGDSIRLPADIYEGGSIVAYLGGALVRYYIERDEYDSLSVLYDEAVAEFCPEFDARKRAAGDY